MDLYQPLYNHARLSSLSSMPISDLRHTGMPWMNSKPVASLPSRSDMKKERLLGKLAQGFAGGRANAPAAASVAAEMEMGSLEEGVASMALAEDKGELFEYRIDQPVTLAKHTSALLPIIGRTLQGQKLSLYNQRVNAKPSSERISAQEHVVTTPHARADHTVRQRDLCGRCAHRGSRSRTRPVDQLCPRSQGRSGAQTRRRHARTRDRLAEKGTMLISRRLVEDRTYLVRNRDAKAKIVLIEQPYRADWKLAEPKEPTERTRDMYRFSVSS